MQIIEYPEKKTTISDTDRFILQDPTNGTKSTDFKDIKDSIYGSLNILIPPTINHNGTPRGWDLSDLTPDELLKPVEDGTFKDRYIGDYYDVTISTEYTENEVVRIIFGGFNTYLNVGNTPFTRNHITVTTKDIFAQRHQMHSFNVIDGGFLGTDIWCNVLPKYQTALQAVLNNRIIPHPTLLTNTVDVNLNSNAGAGLKGASTNVAWVETFLSLPSEIQVFGCNICSSSFFDAGVENLQLPLFALDQSIKTCSDIYWLKDVSYNGGFCTVSSSGIAVYGGSSSFYGVRPVFCIG